MSSYILCLLLLLSTVAITSAAPTSVSVGTGQVNGLVNDAQTLGDNLLGIANGILNVNGKEGIIAAPRKLP